MTLNLLNEDIRNLAERASESVVEVRARRGAPSSGVAFGDDGLVVTAEHTLEIEEGIEIATSAGETYGAEILGRDPATGIALLRAAKARLVVPEWREPAELGAFELALVVASSRSQRRVSLTTVSLSGPPWDTESGGRIDRYIETETRLFPGFSGSLLVDALGRGLGLNTAGLRRRAALAIPVSTLRRVAKSLLEHGEVRRGFLGVTTYPVRLPEAVKSQRRGLLVLSVQKGSPADEAGLFLGDVILEVEGERIESPSTLLLQLTEDRVGRKIEARILRAGQEHPVSLTLGARS